ncbi:hypothetical protein CC2G_001327 [Coprinopsis cinerea AmutBmut pab1-1]|nr:hypothetical protein CC2G_001327 [Coprinopsis cinerea AmutBmut pab1-1]
MDASWGQHPILQAHAARNSQAKELQNVNALKNELKNRVCRVIWTLTGQPPKRIYVFPAIAGIVVLSTHAEVKKVLGESSMVDVWVANLGSQPGWVTQDIADPIPIEPSLPDITPSVLRSMELSDQQGKDLVVEARLFQSHLASPALRRLVITAPPTTLEPTASAVPPAATPVVELDQVSQETNSDTISLSLRCRPCLKKFLFVLSAPDKKSSKQNSASFFPTTNDEWRAGVTTEESTPPPPPPPPSPPPLPLESASDQDEAIGEDLFIITVPPGFTDNDSLTYTMHIVHVSRVQRVSMEALWRRWEHLDLFFQQLVVSTYTWQVLKQRTEVQQ